MRTLSVQQVHDNLGEVIGSLAEGKDPVLVAEQGKRMAIIIAPEEYEQLTQRMDDTLDRFFQAADDFLNVDLRGWHLNTSFFRWRSGRARPEK